MTTPGSPFVWSQAPVALMSAPALPLGLVGEVVEHLARVGKGVLVAEVLVVGPDGEPDDGVGPRAGDVGVAVQGRDELGGRHRPSGRRRRGIRARGTDAIERTP